MQAPLIDRRWRLARKEPGAIRGDDPADEAIGPECPLGGPPHGGRARAGTSGIAPQLADAPLEAAP